MAQLIQRLGAGPVDVVGDVHGELDALTALMTNLGYDEQGRHPAGRRLVFVGDLCDRGPDSPGVIRLVQSLVESGHAQAICGNHELNLLRGEHKHGNHWFYGEAAKAGFSYGAAITPEEREPILRFFRSLPVALERSDLRVVHAAWFDAVIDQCRGVDVPVDEAYERFDRAMLNDPTFQQLRGRYEAETKQLGEALTNPASAPAAVAIGPYDEYCQMRNPIRVITSGVELITDAPFHASGKWRYVNRVAWWREYAGAVPVLFGHYWRWWDPSVHQRLSKGEPQLFADDPVGPEMEDHHNTFCVDFSAGARYKQRLQGHPGPYDGRLAAMRWPERRLVFDGKTPAPLAGAHRPQDFDTLPSP